VDYEKDMEINPGALDVEWLEQPGLMMKYARYSAEATRQADQAKERLEVVKAELDAQIRTDPEKYGIAKITENSVHATLLLQTEYQEASQELINAQYEQNLSKYAAQAVNARKDALENLVRLHGMQYFAGPNIPRDLDNEWAAHIKQQSVDGRVKMTRRRREAE